MASKGGKQRNSVDSELSRSAGYLVRQTHKAFVKSLERRLRDHDISISSWFFLRILWEQDGLTQKELGDQLNLTQPTTVSAMDTLERSGLIVRKQDERDRRKRNVKLTRKGRSLKEKLLPFADEVNSVACKDLTKSEHEKLFTILGKIQKSLEQDAVP